MNSLDFVYLDAPREDHLSEENEGPNLRYGALSMQGWRRTQEDAISCIMNYGNEGTASLFGVYDGHGGPEIAVFARDKLPGKLQELLANLKGDSEKALVQTFLALDEDLKQPEAKLELIQILQNFVDDPEQDELQRIFLAMRLKQLKVAYDPSEEEVHAVGNEKTTVQDPHVKNGDNKLDEAGSKQQDVTTPADAIEGPGTSGTSSAQCEESTSSTDETGAMEDTGSSGSDDDDDGGPFKLVRLAAPGVDLIDTDPDDSDYDPEKDVKSCEKDMEYDQHVLHEMEATVYSGTTATVALLSNNTLYVANAGDSRCVVSRSYKAIDLTEDHKPENPEELKRIVAAGGEVNDEGRINDGLNLSRALGDFVYKSNSKLPPESQMVSCIPDITVHTLIPEDRFMVIACDGIWNSMTSQEIVDYVNLRLDAEDAEPVTLVKIMEEIMTHILPPDTQGDGTGLDNMSMIIVVFNPKKRTPDEDQAMDTA